MAVVTPTLTHPMPNCARIVDARVKRVYDGDTIWVEIPDDKPLMTTLRNGSVRGFSGTTPIRLRNVAAPEVRNVDGDEFKVAGLLIRDILRTLISPGSVVRLWPSEIVHIDRPICGVWRVGQSIDVCQYVRDLPTVMTWTEYEQIKALKPKKQAWRDRVLAELEDLRDWQSNPMVRFQAMYQNAIVGRWPGLAA